jgi:hypothetical protein
MVPIVRAPNIDISISMDQDFPAWLRFTADFNWTLRLAGNYSRALDDVGTCMPNAAMAGAIHGDGTIAAGMWLSAPVGGE